jgi:hypothetical protein
VLILHEAREIKKNQGGVALLCPRHPQFRENNSLANADAFAKVLLLVSTRRANRLRRRKLVAKTNLGKLNSPANLVCWLILHGGDGGGRSNFIISEHEPRM